MNTIMKTKKKENVISEKKLWKNKRVHFEAHKSSR